MDLNDEMVEMMKFYEFYKKTASFLEKTQFSIAYFTIYLNCKILYLWYNSIIS